MKRIIYKDRYPYQNKSLEDLPGEKWLPVMDFEDAYHVSNLGRIKSIERWVSHKYGRVLLKPRIIAFSNRKDYNKKTGDYTILLRCTLQRENQPYYRSVSRLVYETFKGEIPPGHVILHQDFDGRNNRIENLIAAPNSQKGKRTYENDRINGDTLKYIDRTKLKKLLRERLSKKVAQYDSQGNLVKIYPSVKQAEAEGYDSKSISWVCKGRWKHHKGFVWRWV